MPFRFVRTLAVAYRSCRPVSLLVCALSPFTMVHAQAVQSFPWLFHQAEQDAPRLQESSFDVSSAEGHARQATAWPNPMLGLEIEDVGGTGYYRGTVQSQTTLSLSEPVELGGKRSARIALGRAELDAADAKRLQRRIEFGYDLAMAYATAEAAQTRVALLAEEVKRSQEDVRRTTLLVTAGREAPLRAALTEAAESIARAEMDAARAEVAESLALLASLAGSNTVYAGVNPSLLNASDAQDPALLTAPEIPPEVETSQADQQIAQRRLAVETKRAIPTPSITIGVRRIAGDDALVFVAGISVPLPVLDRNGGEISAARAQAGAAQARLAAARLNAAAAWNAAVAKTRAAANRVRAFEQAEAAAGEGYALARIGYEAGRTALLELLSTRRGLIDAQLRALDARVDRTRAFATLARLAGRIPFVE